MATRMLIDARHPEETRVAVVQGNRIEEFDFESAEHKQIKGNIYLAKVTRVEPSLQAAFVDFGGNRHGFLAFSEIHPDYYQIPKEDREQLLAEEAEAADEEARLRAEEEEEGHSPGDEYDADDETGEQLVEEFAEDGVEEIDTSEKDDVSTIEDGQVDYDDDANPGDDDTRDDEGREDDRSRGRGRGRRQGKGGGRSRAKEVDEVRAKRMALRRRYKIQDVIQRRQVLLVQVVKEERGNKGAALTTYLSLAGRYCVLMPNSSHGGGISRKISSAADRKRLKSIVSDLSLPRSMGLIVRTAGLQRTKPEIKRDFDYLARLWDEIRENTLKSVAPALIHSDSDLIKRAIRDIYNKEIEEVVVEGEQGYRAAREFMKLLMPSHARRVKAYSDPVPLFQRYGAEDQLRAMYDPVVQLKSGGYLVINPTEALVSIDINSGRSTKEHGIEATALSTNLEAAREIARQLRLRDMAGLVVIDFIDMEYGSNVRKVEKAMKDALKNDRARIQVGRISGFGLMEMSRQRLRTGVLEATTRSCPHCDGTGLVRTASSAGLSALRLIEDEAARGKGSVISLYASTEAAVYLLNAKRADLAEIEDRYSVAVEVLPEGEDEGAKMRVASSGPRPTTPPKFEPIIDEVEDDPIEEEDEIDEDTEESRVDDDTDHSRKKRRRRGGRNRRDDREGENGAEMSPSAEEDDETTGEETDERSSSDEPEGDEDKPRRRRRRGGRRRRGRGRSDGDESSSEGEGEAQAIEETVGQQLEDDLAVVAKPDEPDAPQAEPEEQPKKRSRRKKVVTEASPAAEEAIPTEENAPEAPAEEKPKRSRRKKAVEAEAPAADSAISADVESEAPAKPKRTRARKAPAAEASAAPVSADPVTTPAEESDPATETAEQSGEEPRGGKRGWWQRTFGD
ncbi:ribonuclease E/G [Altererythrobacter sp. TH136]|uniref:Rne/Rng family ribonuclease n=1 Tax=Altererythrobacter sp. TH136 TaxID=2067415 RepID=UPI001161D9EA|nr:ribonuclease E/G [Altererythrobacter sp. TH136]QDM40004.1 Rne/Rng family ribonuclease [Altererythrobacter sp. TH136]